MQALILVGGEGTRLRPLTESIPKPVLPLAGVPMLAHMIAWLARHGVEDAILACGFLPDRIREVLGDGEPGGPRLTYLHEPEPRGTAGAIKFAERQLEQRFLALNGDVLTDLDLSALIEFHERRDSVATLGLHPVEDASAFGVVTHDDEGRVLEFLEKPPAGGGAEINAGCYVLEREILERIPEETEVSIERDVFPRLAGKGLHALALDGYWIDVGTPDRYLEATWDILEGRVEAEAAGSRVGEAVLIQAGAVVHAGASVGPRAVVGAGSVVEAGASVSSSVLLEDCRVEERATVSGSILGPGTRVAAGAQVPAGSVLGEAASVPGQDG